LKIPHFAGRKFPSPGWVVVYSFGWWNQNDFEPVKRRRALVATNLPRNSWPQTHQDDEARGGAHDGPAPGSGQHIGLIENSYRMVPFAATALGAGGSVRLLPFGQRNQPRFAPFFEPIAFTPDVDCRRVMQQTIKDGRGDDRIAEDRTPFAVALVGSENDAAPLIAGADELEEDRRTELVSGRYPISSMTRTLGAR
jgi:hypothetical protein